MTVPSTTQRVDYDGDGATRSWPITFSVNALTSSDIVAYKVQTDGTATLISVSYTLDLDEPDYTYPTVASGLDPLTAEEGIIILRQLDLKQEIDYKNQGALPAQTIEDGMDRLTYMLQQLEEEINRCIQMPVTETDAVEYAAVLAAAAAAAAAYAGAASDSADDASTSVSTAAGYAQDASDSADDAATSLASAISTINEVKTQSVNYILDGNGSEIADGLDGVIQFRFAGTVKGVSLLTDQAIGNIVVDLIKCTYAQYDVTNYPLSQHSICAAAKPTITAAAKYADATLTGWTTAFADGDVLGISVNSCDTFQSCTVVLEYERTV